MGKAGIKQRPSMTIQEVAALEKAERGQSIPSFSNIEKSAITRLPKNMSDEERQRLVDYETSYLTGERQSLGEYGVSRIMPKRHAE